MKHIFKLGDLYDTQQFANLLAKIIFTSKHEIINFVITLSGDLGTGKTTLVREILQSIGVSGRIKSPTFTIVEPYKIYDINIYHFDLYRFNEPKEWTLAGFDEYFIEDNTICFIEWADKAIELIPKVDWNIKLVLDGEMRIVELTSYSDLGKKCLMKLIQIEDNLFN